MAYGINGAWRIVVMMMIVVLSFNCCFKRGVVSFRIPAAHCEKGAIQWLLAGGSSKLDDPHQGTKMSLILKEVSDFRIRD
jgi:hypothetical protein